MKRTMHDEQSFQINLIYIYIYFKLEKIWIGVIHKYYSFPIKISGVVNFTNTVLNHACSLAHFIIEQW